MLERYGSFRLAQRFPQDEARHVAVIQGNNDPGWQWKSEFHAQSLDTYLRLTSAALRHRPALIVWPESAVTFFPALESYYRDKLMRLIGTGDVELILGAPHADTSQSTQPRYFNSAFHIAGGEINGRYDKVHLLPFAEYFPLQTISLLRRRFEQVRTFTPGGAPQLLASPLGPAAVVICFEGIFPALVRTYMQADAAVLLNLSNDAWLGAGAGPEQHLAMVALRAVENRTWVIRATTTGISAIIDPYGRIVARTRENEEAILEHDVRAVHFTTLYERIGDSFAWACALLVLAMLTIPAVGSRVAGEDPQSAR